MGSGLHLTCRLAPAIAPDRVRPQQQWDECWAEGPACGLSSLLATSKLYWGKKFAGACVGNQCLTLGPHQGIWGVGSAVPGLAALRVLDNPTQMHVCELTVSRASRFGRGL